MLLPIFCLSFKKIKNGHLCPLHQAVQIIASLSHLIQPEWAYKIWSGQRDSNSRHQAWEACTLPTELCPRPVHSRNKLIEKYSDVNIKILLSIVVDIS
jgi:hypothetical protein